MKSSLWIVIALVTGIVGFLMGYSVSSSTGSRAMAGQARGAQGGAAAAVVHPAAAAPAPAAPQPGAAAAEKKPAAAAGY